MFATINDLETFLNRTLTPGEIIIGGALIETATANIREYLGRHVTQQEFFDASATPVGSVIVLPDWPVTSLVIVEAGSTLVEGDDWRLEPRGVVRRVTPSGEPSRWWGPVTVTGTVGHDPLPGWAVAACCVTVSVGLDEDTRTSGVGPVVSEKIVDHSLTWADPSTSGSAAGGTAQAGLPALAESILSTERRGDGLEPTVHTLRVGVPS